MFTIEQKWAVINALRAAKKLHLVTHESPDKDGMGAMFLAIKKARKHAMDPSLVLHFVPHGQMLDFATMDPMDIPGPNDVVLHVDTGGIIKVDVEHSEYEPIVLVIDHHFEGCEYHSATGIIFELLYTASSNPAPRYARDLKAFVDRTDSGNKVAGLSDEAYEALGTLNELVDEEDGRRIGRFVANHPGPIWLSKVIHNQAPWVDDQVHMRALLYSLEAEAYGAQKFHELRALYATAQPITVNGLQIAVIPKNLHDPKDIRSFMNGNHHEEVDVFVTEIGSASRAYGKGRFAIAILSRKDDMVIGMEDVARELNERFEGNEIFLHHDHFVIYVKPPATNIVISDVLEVIQENLRRAQ